MLHTLYRCSVSLMRGNHGAINTTRMACNERQSWGNQHHTHGLLWAEGWTVVGLWVCLSVIACTKRLALLYTKV